MPLDLRRESPYSSYEKFDFNVATHNDNDVYSRYRVRLMEFRESAKIVKQRGILIRIFLSNAV